MLTKHPTTEPFFSALHCFLTSYQCYQLMVYSLIFQNRHHTLVVFILSSTRRTSSRAPLSLSPYKMSFSQIKKTFLQHMLFLTKSQEPWSTCSSEAVHQLRLECRLTRPSSLCTVPPAHWVLTTTDDSLKTSLLGLTTKFSCLSP